MKKNFRWINLLFLTTFLFSLNGIGQDYITFNSTELNRNSSISDQFTIYECDDDLSISDFLKTKDQAKGVKIKRSLANLDFTSSYFFFHFKLKNTSQEPLNLILETARPITCSCGSGITACILLLAYQEITDKTASIYDGSWTEWGTLKDK